MVEVAPVSMTQSIACPFNVPLTVIGACVFMARGPDLAANRAFKRLGAPLCKKDAPVGLAFVGHLAA
jgi:hypothetical protein